jgi:hypothetical protein
MLEFHIVGIWKLSAGMGHVPLGFTRCGYSLSLLRLCGRPLVNCANPSATV